MTAKAASKKTTTKKTRSRSSRASAAERAIAVRMTEDDKLVEDLQRQTRFEDFHEHMDLPTFQQNAVLSMLDLLYPSMDDHEKGKLVPHLNGDPVDDVRSTRAYLALRRHQASLLEGLAITDTAEAILKGEGLQKVLLREQIRAAMDPGADSRERSTALMELMARIAPVARESAGMVLFQMRHEDVEFWRRAELEIAQEARIMKQIEAPKPVKKGGRRLREGPAAGEKKRGG